LRTHRLRRIDDLLREVISETLLTKVQDPRIGLVTVTSVETSREFDVAKVFVSILGDEEKREESLRGLKSAASFLQAELAHSVRLRRIPRLQFLYDPSLDRALRIEEKLRDLASEGKGDEAEDVDE
jgi:ribosome-binding factor A